MYKLFGNKKLRLILNSLLVLVFIGLLTNCGVKKEEQSEINILDEIKNLFIERYYDKSQLEYIISGLDDIKNNPNRNLSEELNRLFDSLQVSHIGFWTPDDIDYYELLDTFKGLYGDRVKTFFPPDGNVKYPGIGIVPRLINGRYYVAYIYADTPASQIDILIGDELLTVDGQPYSPVNSFQNKVGKTVKLTIRRTKNGSILERDVAVVDLIPMENLTASITNSAKVFEHSGYKIGYIRMYSYAGTEFGKILIDTISSGSFSSADALVLDIRARWGGAPLDAAELFVGGTSTVEFFNAENELYTAHFRWKKPLVVIIDSGTRSGLEIMAYSLKKAGIPIIGSNTAGAVVGGMPLLLSDGSMLMIAGLDVLVDGNRLEGVGVAPTIPVDSVLEYSQGNDPQFEMAMNKILEIIRK